jgi:hypothetical protein
MGQEQVRETDTKNVAVKGFLWLGVSWISLPLFFLTTGRSLGWWQAWIWCAIILIPMTVFGVWAIKADPEFLARRFKAREKDPSQRRVQAFGAPFYLATLWLATPVALGSWWALLLPSPKSLS